MKKNITFKLCDTEVVVPVNFDTIERIERAFASNADVIASVILPNMQSVSYSRLARAVWDVIYGYSELQREDVLNFVVTAEAKAIAQFALNLQIACLYLRNQMSDGDFDAYAAGESPKKTTGDAS